MARLRLQLLLRRVKRASLEQIETFAWCLKGLLRRLLRVLLTLAQRFPCVLDLPWH